MPAAVGETLTHTNSITLQSQRKWCADVVFPGLASWALKHEGDLPPIFCEKDDTDKTGACTIDCLCQHEITEGIEERGKIFCLHHCIAENENLHVQTNAYFSVTGFKTI